MTFLTAIKLNKSGTLFSEVNFQFVYFELIHRQRFKVQSTSLIVNAAIQIVDFFTMRLYLMQILITYLILAIRTLCHG